MGVDKALNRLQYHLNTLQSAHRSSARRIFKLLHEKSDLINAIWDKAKMRAELEARGFGTATINTSITAFYNVMRKVSEEFGPETAAAAAMAFAQQLSQGITSKTAADEKVKPQSEVGEETTAGQDLVSLLLELSQHINSTGIRIYEYTILPEELAERLQNTASFETTTIDESWFNLVQTNITDDNLKNLIAVLVWGAVISENRDAIFCRPISELTPNMIDSAVSSIVSLLKGIDDHTKDDISVKLTVDLCDALGLTLKQKRATQYEKPVAQDKVVSYPADTTTTRLAQFFDKVESDYILKGKFSIDRANNTILFVSEESKDPAVLLELLKVALEYGIALQLDTHFNVKVEERDTNNTERI